jgi:CRISPR-associated protein Csm1
LWADLTAAFEQLPGTLDCDARLTTVLHLLQRYTWCVPSAYYRQNVADISLYDHLRTTAAIAAALDRSGLDDEALAALLAHRSPDWDTPRLALLAADVTGIQRFLYTLTAARAARSLRGRSFFLQLVTEAVGRWLLRRLHLPLVNLLYAGGGRCYLLTQLPSDDQLAALRRDLDRILLATTDGELYLALACQPVACVDLAEPERFRAAWEARKGRPLPLVGTTRLARHVLFDQTRRLAHLLRAPAEPYLTVPLEAWWADQPSNASDLR